MKPLLPAFLPLGGLAMLVLLYRQTASTQEEPAHAVTSAAAFALDNSPPQASLPFEATAARSLSLQLAPAITLSDQVSGALRHGTSAEQDRAFNQLLPRLVAQDPAAAGHLALAWEAGPLHDELLRQVIRRWAETDVGGALTWLTSLLDPADRQLAATTVIAQVAQSDRAGALDLAQLLRVGLDDGSLEHSVQLWTEDEPRAAVHWVMTQPAGPIRDRLLTRIAHVLK